jgi:uridylate kinase
MENDLPMIVFGMEDEGSIARALQGEKIGTLVHAGPPGSSIEQQETP